MLKASQFYNSVLSKKNLFLKFHFASIISVRSTPLREKGRIQIRISDYRIRMAQKLTDPDPKHCNILWHLLKLEHLSFSYLDINIKENKGYATLADGTTTNIRLSFR
jgi:hypothetical protein